MATREKPTYFLESATGYQKLLPESPGPALEQCLYLGADLWQARHLGADLAGDDQGLVGRRLALPCNHDRGTVAVVTSDSGYRQNSPRKPAFP